MPTEERKQWICSTLDVEGGERVAASPTMPVSMGVAAKKSLWKQDTVLKVRFLEGESALHERVLKAARSWLVDGVRLKIAPAESGHKAQIRIAFDPGRGSWSYVGTDAMGTHPRSRR